MFVGRPGRTKQVQASSTSKELLGNSRESNNGNIAFDFYLCFLHTSYIHAFIFLSYLHIILSRKPNH